jgi:hypothetical protein
MVGGWVVYEHVVVTGFGSILHFRQTASALKYIQSTKLSDSLHSFSQSIEFVLKMRFRRATAAGSYNAAY